MKIFFQDCGKNYHRTWLFRHLNLELDLGNGNQPLRLAVLGGNGSGKSTLTLMISGQTNPTEGSIDWIDSHGKQISSDSWYKHIALASSDWNIELYNLQSQLQYKTHLGSGEQGVGIPIQDLSNGVYFVKITNLEGQNSSIKLIVQH